MQTKTLGNSDMQITPLGFGSWAIGGGNWAGGWGPQDDRQAIEAVERWNRFMRSRGASKHCNF